MRYFRIKYQLAFAVAATLSAAVTAAFAAAFATAVTAATGIPGSTAALAGITGIATAAGCTGLVGGSRTFGTAFRLGRGSAQADGIMALAPGDAGSFGNTCLDVTGSRLGLGIAFGFTGTNRCLFAASTLARNLRPLLMHMPQTERTRMNTEFMSYLAPSHAFVTHGGNGSDIHGSCTGQCRIH